MTHLVERYMQRVFGFRTIYRLVLQGQPRTRNAQRTHAFVIDMRVSAGFGVSLLDGNENRTNEYVTFEGLNGCIGVYVYGDSMNPEYRAGDIVFVRQVLDPNDIDYGRPYVVITKNDRVLKCIYQSKHDATALRLTSLNEETNRHGDRLFPDKEIPKDNIIFIYKVVGMFRREQI